MNEFREINAMLRLNHKNIVRMYNWWFEEEKQLKKEILPQDENKKQQK